MSEQNKNLFTYELSNLYCKIYINNTLHLYFKRQDFVGIQSWIDKQKSLFIEFYFKDNRILCEYDSIEKWTEILKLLNQIEI